jgi:hypothetical protein
MCDLILRDEAGHVAFQRDRLAQNSRQGWLWRAQFILLGYAAGTMLWVNHGKALTAIGSSRAEYYREVTRQLTRFVHRLVHQPRPACVPAAWAPAKLQPAK